MSRRMLMFLVLVIFVMPFSIAYGKYEHLQNGVPVINQAAAGNPNADGWCLAQSKFGGYSVDLPGKYADTMVKIPSQKGGFIVMHHLYTEVPEGGKMDVSFIEFHCPRPDQDPIDDMEKSNRQKGTFLKREYVKILNSNADHLVIFQREELGEIFRLKTLKGDYLLSFHYSKASKDDFSKVIKRVLSTLKFETTAEQ